MIFIQHKENPRKINIFLKKISNTEINTFANLHYNFSELKMNKFILHFLLIGIIMSNEIIPIQYF